MSRKVKFLDESRQSKRNCREEGRCVLARTILLTGDPSTFDFLTDESELNRMEFRSLLRSRDLVKNVKSEMEGDFNKSR